MEDGIENLQKLLEVPVDQLSLMVTLFNFILCIIISFIIRAFYKKYSYSLTGKNHISSVIPILSGVIFLVIVIVKSSLALSLGLVGALSIVRFRTPIKEPEELVYLFLAIAVGLGFGAGYIVLTSTISLSILFVIFIALSNRSVNKTNEYNLMLDWKESEKEEVGIDEIVRTVSEYSSIVKLIRFESGKEHNSAVLFIEPNVEFGLDQLIKSIRGQYREINITFFEAKNNW